jgi:hypothetical protein
MAPDMRVSVVVSPTHCAHHPRPKTPQDLTCHACISLRSTLVVEALRSGRGARATNNEGLRP